MLSREDNLLLMQTGPATPMGELMRRFWIPFMLSRELEVDGDQKRITLLGERLLAFRDTLGRAGLIDEFCAHRRASLYFGRNEDCGIRCSYHGLKFDVTGKCVDFPASPAEKNYADKVRLKAYPVRDVGGVLWAYMGPPGTESQLPPFEWIGLPEGHIHATRWIQDANWFGAIEGELDSSHVGFAHGRLDKVQVQEKSNIFGEYIAKDLNPQLSVHPTPYGIEAASSRRTDDGHFYWRINHFLVPFYTMITSHVGGHITARMWVPSDDEHTIAFTLTYRCERPLDEEEMRLFTTGEVGHPVLIPGTLRPRANRDNDYLLDRQVQRTQHFTGIATVRAQDAALTESAGAMPDRSKEFLGPGDIGIVVGRRLMIRLAKEMAAGQPPEALQHIDDYATRPLSILLPEGTDYRQSPDVAAALQARPSPAARESEQTA